MKTKKESSVPERKIKSVEELNNLAKNKKTILVASIKNIPSSQFQEISKKLRGKAIIKVPKKNLIIRAFDKNEKLVELKKNIKRDFVILFSDLDSFELAKELINNKSPAKAKAGQISPEEIEIPEGPTELIPGPAVSELGALGLKIKIEGGKISINEPKIVTKKGDKITPQVAALLNKLNIKPFKIGFVPICAFDNEKGIFYHEINIDKEGTLKELKESHAKALAFAIKICYVSKDTISLILAKAGLNAKILEKIISKNNTSLENKSVPQEKTEEEIKTL